jgi:hypothetical protein
MAAALERLLEEAARLLHFAGAQRQAAQRVERFSRKDIVAEIARDFEAVLAQLARALGFVPVMENYGEAALRLRQHRALARAFGGADGGFKAFDRFRDARFALARASFMQQIRGTTRLLPYHATT